MTNKIILLNTDEMLLFCDMLQQAYNSKSEQVNKQYERKENKEPKL